MLYSADDSLGATSFYLRDITYPNRAEARRLSPSHGHILQASRVGRHPALLLHRPNSIGPRFSRTDRMHGAFAVSCVDEVHRYKVSSKKDLHRGRLRLLPHCISVLFT